MKKFILSFGVIIIFIAYSFQQRGEGSQLKIAPVVRNSKTSTSNARSSSNTQTSSAKYKDGTYTGSVADAFYGYVQVQATVSGGKITDVTFLQYPNDQPNSQYINSVATPYLKQEAIQAQSSQVDIISGATDTSNAFIQSLSNALSQAQS